MVYKVCTNQTLRRVWWMGSPFFCVKMMTSCQNKGVSQTRFFFFFSCAVALWLFPSSKKKYWRRQEIALKWRLISIYNLQTAEVAEWGIKLAIIIHITQVISPYTKHKDHRKQPRVVLKAVVVQLLCLNVGTCFNNYVMLEFCPSPRQSYLNEVSY